MSATYESSVRSLRSAIRRHSVRRGAFLVKDLERRAKLLLVWMAYVNGNLLTSVANELIYGTQSAVVETAAFLSLGLARAGLVSARRQIDMTLAWLLFKDHPVEWRHVQVAGDGFKLKKEIMNYLGEYYPDFKRKFDLLSKRKQRQSTDPYALLSAHVHGMTSQSIPSLGNLSDVVESLARCKECAVLQEEVSEYLNDVLLACFADDWAALPKEVLADARKRLRPGELSLLFS